MEAVNQNQKKTEGNKMHKIESAKLKSETEKAYLLTVDFGDEARRDVWFPKSQLLRDGDSFSASSWILEQKENDFAASYGLRVCIC